MTEHANVSVQVIVEPTDQCASQQDPTRRTARAGLSRVSFKAGQVVLGQGEEPSVLYLVLSGHLSIARRTPRGRQKIVAVLERGDVCGGLTGSEAGTETMATTAMGPAVLLRIESDGLADLISDHPQVGRYLLQALAIQVRRVSVSVGDHVFLDVGGRLAKWLVGRTVRTEPEMTHDTEGVVMRFSQQHVADVIGTSREDVNRCLAVFARRGWVDNRRGQVRILDAAALRRRGS
jgi:CRP/FNR family cyclic AMP-dependent transcriptional regulator